MPGKRLIKIGTRESLLALAQARWVAEAIEKRFPGIKTEIASIKTPGDLKEKDEIVSRKDFFVKEIDCALLDKKIDIAVHSMKDIPLKIMPGLCLAAITK